MNYYNEIKNTLIDIEVYKTIKDYSKNKYELEKYYQVGKLLTEAGGGENRAKYGDGLIKEYSIKLTKELGKGYSVRTLKYMRKLYLFQKGQPLAAQLSWSHYIILFSINDINKINYYIHITIEENLSYRKLHDKIKSNEYERLDESTKLKLTTNEKITIDDGIKHPIIIKNKFDTEDISEKMLKQLILEDISSFMKELGTGYSFIDSEYKIIIGNTFNYIDLLFFNIKVNAYVVVELKVTTLKKEYIGQVLIYMEYIDKYVKDIYHNKTIGIIITKHGNNFIIEYCSDKRIYNTTYCLV